MHSSTPLPTLPYPSSPARPTSTALIIVFLLFLQVFEGKVEGSIVDPRGSTGAGDDSFVGAEWQSVFLPKGSEVTVAEMSEGVDKEACFPRGAAIDALEVRKLHIYIYI